MSSREQTSKRVASKAGRVQASLRRYGPRTMLWIKRADGWWVKTFVTVGDVTSGMGSALTQARDKAPKSRAKLKRKLRPIEVKSVTRIKRRRWGW